MNDLLGGDVDGESLAEGAARFLGNGKCVGGRRERHSRERG